ncbi:MAG: capsular polysaccharide export protein, LipB/KpsS family [Planctomycetota bacterium]|jgi:hypothetical protein
MPTADVEQRTVLKGAEFTARVAEICAAVPEASPLPDLKYRRILIPGMLGGEYQFALLGFVAHALRMRGADVSGLLCDELLPACTVKKVDHHESACRRWCYKNSGPFVRAARLPHRWYSEFITQEERRECAQTADSVPADRLKEYEWRGIPLGIHVDRSIASYFKVGKFDLDDPEMVAQGRQFLTSAMYLTLIAERVLEELKIDKVFMDDGLKVDWGVVRAVARQRGIPVDVILGTPRAASVLIEHDSHPEPPDLMPLWPRWRDVPLTENQEAELAEYFQGRATNPYQDWSWASTVPLQDPADIRRKMGLPPHPSGLTLAMFPNLGYDAAVTTTRPTYDTAAEWVAETIRFFERWPQHHLIVKAHPAERYRHQPALDPTAEFLAATFDTLPHNILVIPPESSLTAHDVLRVLDVALVYTSTVGVEAAYFGKPVVNVGGGWHAGRGFSIDVNTPQRHFEVLSEICSGRLSPAAPRELGRRYAYSLFFRSTLPIGHFRAMYPRVTGLSLTNLQDLAPGREPTMDIICRGILSDEPFCSEAGSLWRSASQ